LPRGAVAPHDQFETRCRASCIAIVAVEYVQEANEIVSILTTIVLKASTKTPALS